jgi:xylulokinase
MSSYVGIDLGTSGVKSVLMDDAGELVASASAPLNVSRPHPGWSEQNPSDWIDAAFATLDRLAAEQPALMSAVRGIGLSGQMHGATLLDRDDRPLRPCILWNDARAGAECAALEARADFRGVGGNRLMAGFTAPKVEWVRRNEPEIFASTAMVLLPKDYLRLALTGEMASDMSDSSGTLWLDVARRDWSDALLEASGLSRGHMPRLVEGTVPGGRLRRALAGRWGITGEPVVAGGGGDNAAAACGVGAVAPGRGFVSIGTSGVLFVTTEGFSPNVEQGVHAFCHAIPGVWHQMGVILSAADSLNWLARIAGRPAADLAAGVDPDDLGEGPVFLPYLSGERTPHVDASLRGGFLGLSHSDGPEVLARSVLAGVACAFADCADALRGGGADPKALVAVGGGARSDAWLQMIADLARVEVERPRDAEVGAALGAARLGLCAADGADPRAVCAPAAVDRRFAPRPDLADRAAEALSRFRDAYRHAAPALHA